ncbi:MAG: GIY-YIG nuclease family protein [Planctomycetales bacterium]
MGLSSSLHETMNHGKQIRLFLTDGSASGIRYAELMNWTGQGFAYPKALFTKLKEWPETQRAGVYVLVGVNGEGEEAVYIGEAEDVARRLLQHVGEAKPRLDDIVEAFFFTSKDDNLTKGHTTYLEQRLLKRAKEAKQYVVEYGREPAEKTLSRPEAATMEAFLENLYLVAAAMGYSIFEIPRVERLAPDSGGVFTMTLENGITATGYPSEDGFVITSGSAASSVEKPYLQPGYKAIRADLKGKSVLIAEGDRLKFTQDYTFKSSSAAACAVAGASRSGPQSWIRQSDGKSLRDVEKENAKADEQSLQSASHDATVVPPVIS